MPQKRLLSSIGKKEIMAVSGLLLLSFLTAHMIGNMTIYVGSAWFDAYAHHLHAIGPFIYPVEAGLAALFFAHAFFGLWVTLGNWLARPVKYIVSRSSEKRSLGSKLMPFTGIYTLVFVLIHLVNFRFLRGTAEISVIVDECLSDPFWAMFYVVSMIVVALHVGHGAWSLFQTFGLGMTNSRFILAVRKLGAAYSYIVGAAFGLIPLAVWFLGRLRI